MRQGRTAKTTRANHKTTVTTSVVTLPELLTIAEAAQHAHVSKPTIVRAYDAGQLRVFRTPKGGRVLVHADSLARWIERNSVGGAR